MSSPHPTHHQCYHKDRENHTDILHQQENFVMAYCIYLPSPAYSLRVLSHQCKGSGKNFHQSLNYGRTATMRERERATRLTPTRRPKAPLTCELWQDWIDIQLPTLVCDPTIVKDPKRAPATTSLSDLQEL
jgi:hypothetical protein